MLLRHVLLAAIKRDCENATYKDASFEPTESYQRSIKKMLKNPLKWEKIRMRPVWKNVLQKVAVLLITFSLGVGSIMAISPTVRAAMIQWVVEWYETHIIYRFRGDDITGTMPQYEITTLPNGYFEIEGERIEESNYVSKTYQNNEGEQIYFDYTYMQQGSAVDIVTEGIEVIGVSVNGREGQIYLGEDTEAQHSTITWIDAETNLQFTIDACLNQTELLCLAESVSD